MSLDEKGYELLPDLLDGAHCEALLQQLAGVERVRGSAGVRRIEAQLPEIAALAISRTLQSVVQPHLPGQPRLVRTIYFDKCAENNWYVTWHQDRTVAVSARFEQRGWGPWSRKANVWHVQPPLAVLEEMVTVRVHLDAADGANGGLKVIPGSHRYGLLNTRDVGGCVDPAKVVVCSVPAGGAVVMRPHLLHASDKAVQARPRRVLHFEYSSFVLPEGVGWAT